MRTLWRREQAALSMGGTALGLGAGALWLSFTNDPPRDPFGRAMCVLAAPVCIAAGLLARALLQEEERLANLLRSTRTKAWVSALAMIGVVCAPNAAYASAATHAVSAHAPARSLGADFAAGGFGLAVALLVSLWARKHARGKRRSPATFVAGTIGIALGAIIMGVMW